MHGPVTWIWNCYKFISLITTKFIRCFIWRKDIAIWQYATLQLPHIYARAFHCTSPPNFGKKWRIFVKMLINIFLPPRDLNKIHDGILKRRKNPRKNHCDGSCLKSDSKAPNFSFFCCLLENQVIIYFSINHWNGEPFGSLK